MILNPKGQSPTRYSHLSSQCHHLRHRPPHKQGTEDVTRGTKVGVGINNNEVKKVGIEVPVEVEIREEMSGKRIPKTGIERNQALYPLGRKINHICLKTEINCQRRSMTILGNSVFGVASHPTRGGIAELTQIELLS